MEINILNVINILRSNKIHLNYQLLINYDSVSLWSKGWTRLHVLNNVWINQNFWLCLHLIKKKKCHQTVQTKLLPNQCFYNNLLRKAREKNIEMQHYTYTQ